MADSLSWSQGLDRLRRENEALAEINARLAAEKLGLEQENAKLKEELAPVRPVVTRLTTWKGVCPQCGEVHSTHPLQVSQAQGAAGVHLGPRAVAWATLLNKQFGIPLRKTCSILARGFGLKLSAGGLAQMLHRVANKLRPRYEALREQVRASPVNY